MFGAGHDDSIVKRGIDEALACRDMLTPAPVQPSLLARVSAHIEAALRSLASALSRERADGRRTPESTPETSR